MKTSIDWLIEELVNEGIIYVDFQNLDCYKKAKEMHKKEMIAFGKIAFEAGTEYLSTPEQALPFAEENYELKYEKK